MGSKFDSMVVGLEELLKTVKGEVYEFSHKRKKNSAKVGRKALSDMRKICFDLRKEILDTLKAMPVQKRAKK
jgi:signal transduction histidine kinase